MDTTITTLLTATGGAFLGKFVGPLAEHYGKIALERWQQLAAQANELLAASGSEPQPVPPKILLPLLEAAALEDDAFLQKAWANLLANAASPHKAGQVEVGFVEILKQLMPVHVRILTALFPESRGGLKNAKHVFTMDTSYIKDVVMAEGVSESEFDIAFDNLVRLRLCTASGMFSLMDVTREMMATQQPNPTGMAMATGNGTANIGPTKLGIAFLEACSAPNAPDPS